MLKQQSQSLGGNKETLYYNTGRKANPRILKCDADFDLSRTFYGLKAWSGLLFVE
jgi:hypothetical protein